MKLKEVIGSRQERFQVDEDFTFKRSEVYFFDQRRLANICGTAAFLLPVTILAISWSAGSLRYSISHNYYVPFLGDVFVGTLCVIGALLIAYRGSSQKEDWITIFAGFCAIAVALIPVEGAGRDAGKFAARIFVEFESAKDAGGELKETIAQLTCEPRYFCFFEFLRSFHAVSAAVLFGTLAFLNLFVFTRVDAQSHTEVDGTLTEAKKRRDVVYIVCGWTILTVLFALVGAHFLGVMGAAWWNQWRLTFWGETIMVLAFGVSWMTKGQLIAPVRDRHTPIG